MGQVLGAATYLINHPIFGWVSFGGNLQIHDGVISVEPRDSVRKRLFIAEVGLWVEFDAGTIERFTFDPNTCQVEVSVFGNSGVSNMKWEQSEKPLSGCKVKFVTEGLVKRLDGLAVSLPAVVRFVNA